MAFPFRCLTVTSASVSCILVIALYLRSEKISRTNLDLPAVLWNAVQESASSATEAPPRLPEEAISTLDSTRQANISKGQVQEMSSVGVTDVTKPHTGIIEKTVV